MRRKAQTSLNRGENGCLVICVDDGDFVAGSLFSRFVGGAYPILPHDRVVLPDCNIRFEHHGRHNQNEQQALTA